MLTATLLGVAVAPYLRVGTFGFVFDDQGYVTTNGAVLAGLSLRGVRWAFTSFHMGAWHPLTWLFHMTDVSLFGQAAQGPHLVNLALHGANTLLLYAFLRGATGSRWRSCAVASLFAVHPFHVESVAWISERKGLLSSFFFLSCLVAYRRYAARPSALRYATVAAFLTLGLLAKAMLVTTPLVLLLCDFWPLNRAAAGCRNCAGRAAGRARLLLEKMPLAGLCAGASAVAYFAQGQAEALGSLEEFGAASRLKNAAASYVVYIVKTLWPTSFWVHYRQRGDDVLLWQALAAAAALSALTVVLVAAGRRRGYLAAGWGWYLLTLLPVIGLIQVGSHGMADRYTYLPLIGLFVVAVWGVADAGLRLRIQAGATGIASAAIVSALLALSWRQAGYWRDEVSLFGHAAALDRNNWLVLNNLGLALLKQKRLTEAADRLGETVRLFADHYHANLNLGVVLDALGRKDEAVAALTRAIALRPASPEPYFNLGLVHVGRGDKAAARAVYRQLLAIDPTQASRLLPFIDAKR